VQELIDLRINLEAWLILGAVTALPAAAIWFYLVRPRPLLPPVRRRLVPWSGFEILAVLFLVLFFWPALAAAVVQHSGFLNWLYGDPIDPVHKNAAAELASDRLIFWTTILAWPEQVATIILVLRLASNTRPYQLGLTTYAAPRNVVAGWLGFAGLTPFVISVHLLMLWVFRSWFHFPAEDHPVLRVVQARPAAVEACMMILMVVVLAPVLEEILFRGMLQPWLARQEWGGQAAVLGSLVITMVVRYAKIQALHRPGATEIAQQMAPFLFILLLAPGLLLLHRLPRNWGFAQKKVSGTLRRSKLPHLLRLESSRHLFLGKARNWLGTPCEGRALYGTALLFAMSHANVWPAPIPLFLLALGLGWLAQRTQSLLGPMIWHALFNGVACVELLLTRS